MQKANAKINFFRSFLNASDRVFNPISLFPCFETQPFLITVGITPEIQKKQREIFWQKTRKMDLTGFIRDDYCAKINSFKLWDLNIDKAPSATLILKKLALEDRHITVTEPSQFLQTASLLTFIFSTKDPAAPANILCMCQWERTSDTSITFRSPKMWSRWSPH